jgi:hypothetical protein
MGTTQEQSSEFVYSTLQKWFAEYGIPRIIYCDNGGPFKNKCKHWSDFQYRIYSNASYVIGLKEKLRDNYDIKMHYGTPGNPSND